MMPSSKYIFLGVILATTICCTKNPGVNSEEIKLYSEQHRPQFHFSPPEKWMNDPNGMVYYKGEYHLFYQYYPDSTVWGPMHWGHAVSKDLIHWENLPIALYPDSIGMIFSGSAVVDRNNSSGLGSDEEPPLVAIFTYHDMKAEKAGKINYQTQGLAYSNDRGRTWKKYAGNPVLPNPGIKDFRDPKVFWYEPGKKWVMTLAVHDHVSFYSSPDLKTWKLESDFGKENGSHNGVWECPDLFPLKIDGEDSTKWVLLLSINPGGPNGGSATQYFIGNFDGNTFRIDQPRATLWLDGGRDNYAGVTWSDIPKEDGRRIFLGWMSNWLYGMKVPTEKWRSSMTIPKTLSLHRIDSGLMLFSSPVNEINSLRSKEFSLDTQHFTGVMDLSPQLDFSSLQMEIVMNIELIDTLSDVGIELSNSKGEKYRIGYDGNRDQFYSDRTKSGKTTFSDSFADKIVITPRVFKNKTMEWHIYFDSASVEFFADKGSVTMTEIFFPDEDFNRINIYANGGSVHLKNCKFYSLRSIWPQ